MKKTIKIWGLFKKYLTWIFLQTPMKHGRCLLMGRWGLPSCSFINFFPARRQYQLQAVHPWERDCTHHLLNFNFSWHDGITSETVLDQILPEAWQCPSGSHLHGSVAFGHYTNYRMVQLVQWRLYISVEQPIFLAYQCRATHIPVSSQQAIMTRSMTKCRTLIMQYCCVCSRTVPWLSHYSTKGHLPCFIYFCRDNQL